MRKAFVAFLLVICITCGAYLMVQNMMFPLKYEAAVLKYSRQYHVPPHLVAGIIQTESGFCADCAGGLMNLSEQTASRIAKRMGMKYFDESLLTHPETNLKLGIWYLGEMYNQHNFVTTLQMWGERNGSVQTEQQLNDYVQSVAKKRSYYKLMYGSRLQ